MTARPARLKTLRTPDDLVKSGLVPRERKKEIARVAERYAVAIPPAILDLIDPADPGDPIARQFVPSVDELVRRPSERTDPIGDNEKSPVPGIVHRYPDRVLLKVVNVCPVYCRFCFRREMVGPGKARSLSVAETDAALAYIRAHRKIWEVILTGGDPFVLSPRRIAEMTGALDAIGHVKVLRWHTRMPVAAPDRVTRELARAVRSRAKAVYVGLHANHPRELTAATRAACARLMDAGIVMVSQTVLLRGVNDNVETLEALMRALVEMRVKPYYLHHGDLAPGTAHFRTTIAEGRTLMRELRMRLSGLAMPTYVLDIPGGHGKVPIGPNYLASTGDGNHAAEDSSGRRHAYEDCCTGPSRPFANLDRT